VNKISFLTGFFDSITNLYELNISANKIFSFKEALYLNKLTTLKVLSFNDGNFGKYLM
jgi:hypothetical protein